MTELRSNGRGGRADDLATVHGYGRVSKREQADKGLSLPNQFRKIWEHVGRFPTYVVGDEFRDVESGKNDARLDYQRLLLAVRGDLLDGKRVVVYVVRYDRLGRNMLERVRVHRELLALGAEIHSVENGGRVPTFVYDVLSAAADEESRLISARVKDVWESLAAKGWHRPGRPAWGYAWRERTPDEHAAGAPKAVLVVDEATATYARELWRRYADGESVEGLVRWTAGLPASATGGRSLRSSAIRTLLASPVYVGRLGGPHKGPHDIMACVERGEPCDVLEAPRARWDALVDDATWTAVHEQHALKRRLPSQASGEYLLTGLIRCHACGRRMRGNPGNRGRARRDGVRDLSSIRRYVCASRSEGGHEERTRPCYATVLGRKVEQPVLRTVRELLERATEPSLRPAIGASYERQVGSERADDTPRLIAAHEASRSRAAKTLSAASQKFVLGEISRVAYDALREGMEAEIVRSDAEILRLRGAGRRPRVLPIEALLSGLDGWAEALAEAEPRRAREALALLVERVRPVRLARGAYEARIEWTAIGAALLEYACEVGPTANLVSVRRFATTNCRTGTLAPTPAPLRVARPA